MNKAITSILKFLLNQNIIGAKHFPENKLIKSRIKWLNKQEQKNFKKQYKLIKKYLIRLKKRTGKGSSYHISINPKYLKEIKELLENELRWIL